MELLGRFLHEATWPILAASVLVVLIVLLLIFLVIYQRVLQWQAARLKKWDHISENVIMEAIFFEENDTPDLGVDVLDIKVGKMRVPKMLRSMLRHATFRNRLMHQIVSAKRSVSGTAAENLIRLFRQLGFEIDILRMLSTSVWHKQAIALDLIGFMKLSEYEHLLHQYINDEHDLIRMEAQDAIMRFSGFEGLHFLVKSKYQLSEWQQMKMIDELSLLPHEEFKDIDDWLTSPNDSVVIFALKLIRSFHRFELFEQVLGCMFHKSSEVRFHAIAAIKVLPSPDAVPVLLEFYPTETALNKVAILKALQSIASGNEIEFFGKALQDPNFDIRLEAARALQKSGIEGQEHLHRFKDTEAHTLKEIIAQVKEEEER